MGKDYRSDSAHLWESLKVEYVEEDRDLIKAKLENRLEKLKVNIA